MSAKPSRQTSPSTCSDCSPTFLPSLATTSLFGSSPQRRSFGKAWEVHREFIIPQRGKERPGSRPSFWWKYDAPEPRLRLSGVGTPTHECLNSVLHYRFGVPDCWVKRWEIELYSGRVLGIDGKPILSDCDFTGVVPDPDDPPVFESEAAYLERLDLLLPGERRRLTQEDFEPEALVVDQIELDEHGRLVE